MSQIPLPLEIEITDKKTGESYIAKSPKDVTNADHWAAFSTLAIMGALCPIFEDKNVKAKVVKSMVINK